MYSKELERWIKQIGFRNIGSTMYI
jgi:hypothetical protein